MARKIDVAAAPTVTGSRYPAPFDVPCRGRFRLRLGDAAGLGQFGVNLTRLSPGTWSSQRRGGGGGLKLAAAGLRARLPPRHGIPNLGDARARPETSPAATRWRRRSSLYPMRYSEAGRRCGGRALGPLA
ncbi:MAG: hypothetical protein O9284_08155 [Steroidobacteraceae bacterium]|nr:hypothetical protein [Steroidobacteraceae bacterium]